MDYVNNDLKVGMLVRGVDEDEPNSWNGCGVIYEIIELYYDRDGNVDSGRFKSIEDCEYETGIIYTYGLEPTFCDFTDNNINIHIDNRTKLGVLMNDVYNKMKDKKNKKRKP